MVGPRVGHWRANSPVWSASSRRPNTRSADIAGAGHWIHDDAPDAMAAAIAAFLAG